MVTIQDDNRLPEVLRELRQLSSRRIEAGLFADKVSEKTLIAARVNEFGARIRKTPRMRRFLAAMARKYGIRLDPAKGNKDYVVIPPRPFIRSAADRGRNHIMQVAERMLGRVLDGQSPARDALAAVGLTMERLVKDQINRVNAPPLHPLTRAMKGSDKPLIASGVMRNAITFRVK